jgi:hypothetical protein
VNASEVERLAEAIQAAMSTRQTAAGISAVVDATIIVPLRERIARLEGETRGHTEHAASLLRRLRSEVHETWSAEVPPGGMVCADCGEPVESEPCPDHHPRLVADRLRAERDQFADRVDTLTAVAKGNERNVQMLMGDLAAGQSRIAELEAEVCRLRGQMAGLERPHWPETPAERAARHAKRDEGDR